MIPLPSTEIIELDPLNRVWISKTTRQSSASGLNQQNIRSSNSSLVHETSIIKSLQGSPYRNPFDYSRYALVSKNDPPEPNEPVWQCFICLKIEGSKHSLLNHYEHHRMQKLGPRGEDLSAEIFECPFCFNELHQLENYEKHIKDIHEAKDLFCETCKVDDPGKLLCIVCKQQSTEVSGYKCKICERSYSTESELKRHKLLHTNKTAFCAFCKKQFANIHNLINHEQQAHLPPGFSILRNKQKECNTCKATFANSKALERHNKETHEEQEKLCPFCGKVLLDIFKLRTHLHLHHEKKRHMCFACGKSFAQSTMLKVHMRTHSGEKPYKCATCDKCFTQKSTLTIHKRIHTGERPYVCPICQRGFVSKGALRAHSKSCGTNRRTKKSVQHVRKSKNDENDSAGTSIVSNPPKLKANALGNCNQRRRIFEETSMIPVPETSITEPDPLSPGIVSENNSLLHSVEWTSDPNRDITAPIKILPLSTLQSDNKSNSVTDKPDASILQGSKSAFRIELQPAATHPVLNKDCRLTSATNEEDSSVTPIIAAKVDNATSITEGTANVKIISGAKTKATYTNVGDNHPEKNKRRYRKRINQRSNSVTAATPKGNKNAVATLVNKSLPSNNQSMGRNTGIAIQKEAVLNLENSIITFIPSSNKNLSFTSSNSNSKAINQQSLNSSVTNPTNSRILFNVLPKPVSGQSNSAYTQNLIVLPQKLQGDSNVLYSKTVSDQNSALFSTRGTSFSNSNIVKVSSPLIVNATASSTVPNQQSHGGIVLNLASTNKANQALVQPDRQPTVTYLVCNQDKPVASVPNKNNLISLQVTNNKSTTTSKQLLASQQQISHPISSTQKAAVVPPLGKGPVLILLSNNNNLVQNTVPVNSRIVNSMVNQAPASNPDVVGTGSVARENSLEALVPNTPSQKPGTFSNAYENYLKTTHQKPNLGSGDQNDSSEGSVIATPHQTVKTTLDKVVLNAVPASTSNNSNASSSLLSTGSGDTVPALISFKPTPKTNIVNPGSRLLVNATHQMLTSTKTVTHSLRNTSLLTQMLNSQDQKHAGVLSNAFENYMKVINQEIDSGLGPQKNNCSLTSKMLPCQGPTEAHMASVRSQTVKRYINPFNYSKYASTSKDTAPKPISKPIWQCFLCSKIETSKDSLLEHYENHRMETLGPAGGDLSPEFFECPICFRELHLKEGYEKHIKDKHGISDLICDICKVECADAYTLSVHNASHSKDSDVFTCVYCKQFTSKDKVELQKHIATEEISFYKCKVCDRSFSSLIQARQHRQLHTNKAAFCAICRKQFSNVYSVMKHNRRAHPLLRPVPSNTNTECDICKATFADNTALERHKTDNHETRKSLCPFCGKIFEQPQGLTAHLIIHSEDKNFICAVCGKSCSKSNMLQVHMRTHSGERPYKCATCGKCFTQRTTLVIHQRGHTGERPYVCPKCQRGFVSRGALRAHSKSCNTNRLRKRRGPVKRREKIDETDNSNC